MAQLVTPLTWILGVVLTLAGIAGFFTGDMLLWFAVSPLHNVIHLLSGLIALFAASAYSSARTYLIVFGLVYAVVTVLGFAMGGDVLGLLSVNNADNYLHLAIAAVCLVVGFGGKQ